MLLTRTLALITVQILSRLSRAKCRKMFIQTTLTTICHTRRKKWPPSTCKTCSRKPTKRKIQVRCLSSKTVNSATAPESNKWHLRRASSSRSWQKTKRSATSVTDTMKVASRIKMNMARMGFTQMIKRKGVTRIWLIQGLRKSLNRLSSTRWIAVTLHLFSTCQICSKSSIVKRRKILQLCRINRAARVSKFTVPATRIRPSCKVRGLRKPQHRL